MKAQLTYQNGRDIVKAALRGKIISTEHKCQRRGRIHNPRSKFPPTAAKEWRTQTPTKERKILIAKFRAHINEIRN